MRHRPAHKHNELALALAQAKAGVSSSFEVVFAELAGPISAFAARQGADDPDGVANTALFDAYQALATFEGDYSAFRAFVFRIARNRIIDDFRKQERRPRLVRFDAAEPDVVVDDTPDRIGADEWVTTLLGQLTIEQREVIALRVLGGISIAETARIMDKPISSIKGLQRRAIRRLHVLTGEDVHE